MVVLEASWMSSHPSTKRSSHSESPKQPFGGSNAVASMEVERSNLSHRSNRGEVKVSVRSTSGEDKGDVWATSGEVLKSQSHIISTVKDHNKDYPDIYLDIMLLL